MERFPRNPDDACLQKALQGDDSAFTQLVEMYQTPVYNLCYRMLGNPQEAEDAAQESFWRAYKHIKRYDPQRSFATWLLSIAAHFCIDQQRRRKFQLIDLDEILEIGIEDPQPNPEKISIKHELSADIQKELDKLHESDRAVLILRYWYEFSEDEICTALSLTKSAVKSRLHRARQHMAENWQIFQSAQTKNGRKHESQAI
jgi:RNA polymerase sigma-70 factor, ECF subfamily